MGIISCLIDDIKEFETSKEGFEKQLLQQRDETTELTFKLESEIDSSNKEKMLSNERKVEIKMLYEMVDLLEASAGENENELIFSTQTISRLKEDIKELETSKEGFDKQLLHQRDETGELTLKLRAEIESGNKLKILSKNNQDEIIGLNKSIDLSETIAEEKERTISCLKENIKELETSKEGFGKQSQQQRDETAELSVRLKTMIDSGNKLKILSKERQDEITRLNESRELLETIAEEKERKISCLKEDIKELEISKEGFGKQLLQQRDESAKITLNLKTEIDSSNKVKILSKERQDEIKMLYEMVELLEARAGENENELICNTQTISCLKEDIKEFETSKEVLVKQLIQQRDETAKITLNLKTEIDLSNKVKTLSKENQGEIIRLNESRDLLEASIGEKESTISCLKENIKELETSKEGFGKQLQQQRDEATELSLKLKTEIDSGKKLKIVSKKRQDEIKALSEMVEFLEARAGENENELICSTQTISCLKEDIKELETSKEDFDKQLTLKLNTVIESGNKLKILSKENQDEIIRLSESRNLLEASIEEKENELTSSIQTISSLKEDIKLYKMNHDCDLIKIEEVNH